MKGFFLLSVALVSLSTTTSLTVPNNSSSEGDHHIEWCPDDFVNLDGRCIFIATDVYHGQAGARTWSDSRDVCTSFFGEEEPLETDLASVDVSLLSAFTAYIVENIPGMKGYVFWTGSQLIDGKWQWTDGTPISELSYVWYMPDPTFSSTDNIYGQLVPAGAFNRFYMHEYGASAISPSFLCEAKIKIRS